MRKTEQRRPVPPAGHPNDQRWRATRFAPALLLLAIVGTSHAAAQVDEPHDPLCLLEAVARAHDSSVETPSSSTPATCESRAEGERFECSVREHHLEGAVTEAIAVANMSSSLFPGVVASARHLALGQVVPLTIPRSTATLSIDLPIADPTETVTMADTAQLQTAVASLHRRAAAEISDWGERLSLTVATASSLEEGLFHLGINGGVSTLTFSGSLGLAYTSDRSAAEHSVIVRIARPLYTIRFADDQHANNRDLFAASARWEGIDGLCARQLQDDRAGFVESVTYGSMLVFVATSTEHRSAESFSLAFRAAYNGLAASGFVDGDARTAYQSLMRNTSVRVVQWGGPRLDGAAAAAVQAGNYAAFFSGGIENVVPLGFRPRALTAGRPPLPLRLATTFSERVCCRVDNCETTTESRMVFSQSESVGCDFFCGGGSFNRVYGGPCGDGWTRSSATEAHRLSTGDSHCGVIGWVSDDPSDCRVNVHWGYAHNTGMTCQVNVWASRVVTPVDPLCCSGGDEAAVEAVCGAF